MGSTVTPAIPVLMFHSFAPPGALAPHHWAERLAVAPELLDQTLSEWSRRGWRTMDFLDLRSFLEGKRNAPSRTLVLTADDGYLDNWVSLHPALKAHGFQATVFIPTDFIDPRPLVRAQMTGSAAQSELQWKGYLSWEEMRAMEADGVVRFGSHAKTHTWYFISDRIVDFYRPQMAFSASHSVYRFLWMNANSHRKPFLLTEMDDASVAWGTPVYEFRPALVARRFFPDPNEADVAIEFARLHGGAEFFRKPSWRVLLDQEILRYRRGRTAVAHYESVEESRERKRNELRESRAVLSAGLGRDVTALSCPQGAMDETVAQIAVEEGYEIWTESSWRERGLNRWASREKRVFRCGRGYELFGENASTRARLFSQQIVLHRFSGRVWARIATGLLSAGGRFRRQERHRGIAS